MTLPDGFAMNLPTPDTASEVIMTLRAHQQALRTAGVTHLSLFGSVARNEVGLDSDIDLAAEFGAKNVLLVLGEYIWQREVIPPQAQWDWGVQACKILGD